MQNSSRWSLAQIHRGRREEAQAFGVPHPTLGEEVAVWIQLREGETATVDEIREFCRDEIAHYKIPKHVRFVKEFPMTVTGKIQKFEMRKAMIEESGDQRMTK